MTPSRGAVGTPGGEGPEGAEGTVARLEREELERGRRAPGAEPVEPRPAATIVLARPAGRHFEVLLLRRPTTARFAAGAYVFPGGVIDPADASPTATAAFPEGVMTAERPALVAAARELFEETGILLADDPVDPPRREAARRRLLEDRVTFAGVVSELGLRFERLRAVYLSRWITPVQLTRRYDTRFFLAAGDGPDPALTGEHTAWLWSEPGPAVSRFHAAELPMLFPTWKTLEGLAAHGTLDEALEGLGRREVEPIVAKLEVRDGRVRPLMPGDPGYDEAR